MFFIVALQSLFGAIWATYRIGDVPSTIQQIRATNRAEVACTTRV